MKTYLVTGGAGFIGSNHIFVQGDICDEKLGASLFQKYEIDYVVNFVAEYHVDRSIREPINNCLNLKDLPIYGDGLNIR